MDVRRSVNGALAGGAAAAVWAAQQPADKRAFGSGYDDVELLGKLVHRGQWWPAAGLALHVTNGAIFGAVYAQARPFLPGPMVGRAVTASLTEHVSLWPLGSLVDRYHPARRELTRLGGNRRAFAQAAWRHLAVRARARRAGAAPERGGRRRAARRAGLVERPREHRARRGRDPGRLT